MLPTDPSSLPGLGLVVALLLAPAAAPAQDRCAECHRDASPHVVDDYATGIHHERGLSCAACHGGDPRATDAEVAHGSRAGFKGDLTIRAATIASCRLCHSQHVAAFRAGPHGVLASEEAAAKVPTCTSCHGSHAIGRAGPELVGEAACARCHAGAGDMIARVGELVGRARGAAARVTGSADTIPAAAAEAYDAHLRTWRHRFVQGVHRAEVPAMADAARHLERLARQAEAGEAEPDPEREGEADRRWRLVTLVMMVGGVTIGVVLGIAMARRARSKSRTQESPE